MQAYAGVPGDFRQFAADQPALPAQQSAWSAQQGYPGQQVQQAPAYSAQQAPAYPAQQAPAYPAQQAPAYPGQQLQQAPAYAAAQETASPGKRPNLLSFVMKLYTPPDGPKSEAPAQKYYIFENVPISAVGAVAAAVAVIVGLIWFKRRGASAPASDFVPIGTGGGLPAAPFTVTPKMLGLAAPIFITIAVEFAMMYDKRRKRAAAAARDAAKARAESDTAKARADAFGVALSAASAKQIQDTLRALTHLKPRCETCFLMLLEEAIARGVEIPPGANTGTTVLVENNFPAKKSKGFP